MTSIDHIKQNALLVKEQLHITYNLESINFLEGFIERQRGQFKGEDLEGLIGTLGSFLGEAIIENYGGQWHQEEQGFAIMFDSKNKAYPFAKVKKQFENGLTDSVYLFYTNIPLLFEVKQQNWVCLSLIFIRLYKVEVLNPHKNKRLNRDLVKDAPITRAVTIKYLEEIPVSQLFGPHGKKIVDFINRLQTIDVAKVEKGISFNNNQLPNYYNEAWDAWITEANQEDKRQQNRNFLSINSGQGITTIYGFNHGKTSPIGPALSIAADLFWDILKEQIGESAFHVNDEDQFFDAKYQKVQDIFLFAMMSSCSHKKYVWAHKSRFAGGI